MRVIQVNTQGPVGPTGPQGDSIFNNVSGSIWATTSSLQISNSISISGSTSINGTVTVSGSIIPGGPYTNNTSSYSLGSPTAAWKDLYVSNGSVSFINGNTSSSISLSPSGSMVLNNTIITGSLIVTGSTTSTNGFTGSLLGTASWATNAVTASYIVTAQTASYVLNAISSSYAATTSLAPNYVLNSATSSFITSAQTSSFVLNSQTSSMSVATASYVANAISSSLSSTASYLNTLNQNLIFNGNLTLNGTASVTYLNTVYETASIIYSTGSNQFGDAANDTQTLYGSVIIPTGSLTVTGSIIISSSANTQLQVGSNLLYVSSSGNVGINTSTPAYNLDVNGTARIQNHIYLASGFSYISLGNNVNLRSNIAGGAGYVVDVQSFNTLNGTNNEQGFGLFSGTYAPTSATGSPSFNGLKILPTINQTGGANGITRGLYINPTLTAAADFRAIETTSGSVLFSHGSNTLLFASSSGKVGIGTSTPISKFTIQVSGSTQLDQPIVSAVGGSTFAGWLIYSGSSEKARYAWNTGDGAYIYTPGTDPFTIYTNSNRALRIDSSQNVGIGTTTPVYKLDVSGSGRFTNGLTITGSVNISNILTLTPQSPLPSGVATGSFAVSSSVPPKPYFYDGTTWNALY